jgi:hypothetical protein
VNTYSIQGRELDAINGLGMNALLWTSIGSVAASQVVTCVWSSIQSAASVSGSSLGFYLLCLGVACVAFLKAYRCESRKSARIETILAKRREQI